MTENPFAQKLDELFSAEATETAETATAEALATTEEISFEKHLDALLEEDSIPTAEAIDEEARTQGIQTRLDQGKISLRDALEETDN